MSYVVFDEEDQQQVRTSFSPVKKLNIPKKQKKAKSENKKNVKSIEEIHNATVINGYKFINFTGMQRAKNLLKFMQVLTSNQFSSARFNSFFNIFEISYYCYTLSFPCLYFLLQRYTI